MKRITSLLKQVFQKYTGGGGTGGTNGSSQGNTDRTEEVAPSTAESRVSQIGMAIRRKSNAVMQKVSKISEHRQALIDVQRPVYDQDEFDENYGISNLTRSNTVELLKTKLQSNCSCSRTKCKAVFKDAIPVTTWLRRYRWKRDLISDITAGATVGIMNIPQGMAYGMLTGLMPVYGLYTSLFPALVYAVFGTSRHVAVGTFAIISLMVRTSIETAKESLALTDHNLTLPENGNTSSILAEISSKIQFVDPAEITDVEISCALTFLVGLYMIAFGCLRLGFISSYLSDQLVQGLTTGAAFHVFTSQLAPLLGISRMPSTDVTWGLLLYYIELFKKIAECNVAVVIGSGICLFVLYVYKEYLNDFIKRKLKFAFPMEFVVVVVATLTSHFAELNSVYEVPIVKTIPTGLPVPKMPHFELFNVLLTNALLIAIMTFSLSVSMSKLFAKQHDYEINPNQEWFAFGIAQTVSSFFGCFCSCGSLSRSAVQNGQGGKTQLASIVGCSVILVVLLFMAELFSPLPKCALAAIIVVNLRGMFWQLKELPSLWKHSTIDFLIWIATFGAVIILNVTYGLMIGVAFAIMSVIFRSQWPDSVLLGKVADTDIYKALDVYQAERHFAEVASQTDHSCDEIESHQDPPATVVSISGASDLQIVNSVKQELVLHHIVIDCSTFPYVDVMGVSCLKQVYEEFRDLDITVLFATCKVAIRYRFECCKFYEVVPKRNLFLSVHDAVMAALEEDAKTEQQLKA